MCKRDGTENERGRRLGKREKKKSNKKDKRVISFLNR